MAQFFIEVTSAGNFKGQRIFLEAVTNMTHAHKGMVTDFPIENGISAADHVVIKPLTLSVSGLLANLRFPTAENGLSSPNLTIDRPFITDLLLQGVQADRALCFVQTDHIIYENMVIESFTITKSDSAFKTVKIDIELKQALIVSTKTQKLKPRPKLGSGKAKVDAGAKPQTPAEASSLYHFTMPQGVKYPKFSKVVGRNGIPYGVIQDDEWKELQSQAGNQNLDPDEFYAKRYFLRRQNPAYTERILDYEILIEAGGVPTGGK